MEGVGLFLLLLSLIFYFLPTIIAHQRDHDSMTSIFLVNLFFGWTIIAWLAAVIWASTGNKTVIIDNSLSPSNEGRIRCPDCAELVLKEARICKHCGRELIEEQGPSRATRTGEAPEPQIVIPIPTAPESQQKAIPKPKSWVEQAKAELAADRKR